MQTSDWHAPRATNEPVLTYAPGSPERATLKARLDAMSKETVEIPLDIGGKAVTTGRLADVRKPHAHAHVLGRFHNGSEAEVNAAAKAAAAAWPSWSTTPWRERAAVFLRAADLLAGPWRATLNAATMLGQSKSAREAEIDSACELIDFLRFNVSFFEDLQADQPYSPPDVTNSVELRPLEGFVFAVTPFNFTAIAGNLPTAPALAGNTVIWKPASSAMLSAHYVMQLLKEAGLPDGVINMVPGPGGAIGKPALLHPDFAGLHFTGSTATFNDMWTLMAQNLARYRGYPRVVGETGGKDFVFAHASANVRALAVALARGAFEYQGQKCSAASRAYIPKSLWPRVRDELCGMVADMKMGGVEDFSNFINAVIDQKAFQSIKGYIDYARREKDACEIVTGGETDDREGWFIRPTVVLARRPDFKLLREEIFGPVLTVFVYDDARFDETLALCDRGSPYALTGAIFAEDRAALARMNAALRHAAGNFYVNDKPTGAVVNQQPFGGARASGTNDKAGSRMNLLRWVSARTVKENHAPPTDWRYPHLG